MVFSLRINVFIEAVPWVDPHENNLYVSLLSIGQKRITSEEKKDREN
jgi:hypothetical protein